MHLSDFRLSVKVYGICFGFVLLVLVIGLYHLNNQLEVKPKPNVTFACFFSRASYYLYVHVFAWSCDWMT